MDGHAMSDDDARKCNTITLAGKEYILFPSGLAAALNRSERTIRRMHADRIGPPVIEIGNTKLIDPNDIPGWLPSLKQEPAQAGPARSEPTSPDPAQLQRRGGSRPKGGRNRSRPVASPAPIAARSAE